MTNFRGQNVGSNRLNTIYKRPRFPAARDSIRCEGHHACCWPHGPAFVVAVERGKHGRLWCESAEAVEIKVGPEVINENPDWDPDIPSPGEIDQSRNVFMSKLNDRYFYLQVADLPEDLRWIKLHKPHVELSYQLLEEME